MPIIIALDTCALEAEHFDFRRSPPLIALEKAVAEGAAVVVLVDVIDREVRKHVRKQAEAEAADFRKRIDRLRNVGPAGATLDTSKALAELEKLPIDKLAELRDAEWTDYTKRLRAKLLSADDVSVKGILDAYFAVEPPFSKDKPKEFPDAIVIARLRQWAEETGNTVHVVSADGDMKAACDGDRLIHVERIGAVVDEALRQAGQARAIEALHEFVSARTEEIAEQLADRLSEMNVDISDDYDAEAEDISFVSAKNFTFDVIHLGDAFSEVEGSADVEFTVDAEVADYDNATRDEGEYVFLPHNTLQYRATRALRFTMSVKMEGDYVPEDIEAASTQIFDPAKLEVSSDEDEVKQISSWSDDDSDDPEDS